jgi:hypothetical protein
MRVLAPRPAIRALLALMLLLAPLGMWTAALPAAAGARAEQVVAQGLPGGEQVVQPDRQPLSRAAVDRRGDLGRARSVLLGILVGTVLPALVWRRWGRGGRTIQRPRHGATAGCASRAPPGLRTL